MRPLLLALLFLLATPQGKTGRLEIFVRDARTREGVPGVPVSVTFKFPTEPAGPSTTFLTDPRGVAVFSALGTGNYVMKLGEGYSALPFTDYVWIDPGDQKRVEIAVNRIASVSVRILDPDGRPIKDALVTLPTIAYEDGRKVLREVSLSRRHNDGDGVFRISGIPAGEYYLRIEHPEVQAKGAPGESVSSLSYYPGITDLQSAAKINVRGQDLFLGEIRLKWQKTFKVSGTVVNSSPRTDFYFNPVAVSSLEEPSAHVARYNWPVLSQNPKESEFEIDGISPGTYVLYTISQANLFEEGGGTNRTIITVGDRNVDGLRIVVRRSNILVPIHIALNGTSGNPSGSIRIGLRSEERLPELIDTRRTFQGPDINVDHFTTLKVPTEDGMLPAIEDVRYRLAVTGFPPDAFVSDIRSGGSSFLRDGTFVARADVPLEIQIGTQGGILQGVVRDPAGQAVADAAVIVVPDVARRKNSFFYKRASTNSEGNFSVRGLAPGDYQVFALPPSSARSRGRSGVLLNIRSQKHYSAGDAGRCNGDAAPGNSVTLTDFGDVDRIRFELFRD